MQLVPSVGMGAAMALFGFSVQAQPEGPASAWEATATDLSGLAPGDDRLPPSPDAPPIRDLSRTAPQEQKVVYLALDGIELTQGRDDSLNNVSTICGGSFPPYGEGQKREAMLQATYKDWDRYNVRLTTERPESGDFTMAVVSNVPQEICRPNSRNVFGVAPMDCGDEVNNIVFAFHSADDEHNVDHQATVISQEIAHSYGLDHTNNRDGIMNPSPSGMDQAFADTCQPNAGSVFCASQHAQFCDPNELIQNSHAELVAILGEKGADQEAPTVAIVSPTDGAIFGVEEDILVEADASDDGAIASVQLEVDGVALGAPDTSAPYEWALVGTPVGTHVLVATALDAAGNESSSAPVTITVGADGGGDSSGGDPTGGGGTGDGSGGQDSGGTGEPGPGEDSGCGCASSERSVFPGVALMLGLLPVFVRRRAVRS